MFVGSEYTSDEYELTKNKICTYIAEVDTTVLKVPSFQIFLIKQGLINGNVS